MIDTENDFKFIRSYLLNKPTITGHPTASTIATTTDPDSKDTIDNLLDPAQLARTSKWINNLIIHCTHEQRLEIYNDIQCRKQ